MPTSHLRCGDGEKGPSRTRRWDPAAAGTYTMSPMSTSLGQFPLNGSHHGGSGSHGSFVDTLLRGFAWRTGSDVAHSLFRLAPALFIVVVVVVVIVVGARWLRNRSKS